MRVAFGVLGLSILAACGKTPSSPPASDGAGAQSPDSGSPAGTPAGGGDDDDDASVAGGSSQQDAGATSGPTPPGDASAGEGDAGGGAIGSPGSPPSSFLPPVTGTCPTIASGTLTFAGQQVQIWAGTSAPAQPGALVIFWYGTGGSTTDATYLFGQTQIDAVTAGGGVVAAIGTSNKQGTDTGDAVWYTGDFATADEVVACALQQKRISASRIYTTGDSAGGLQATWMAYARSGYLAAVAPLSGGLIGYGNVFAAPTNAPQDPSNVPAAIVTHGKEGVDVVEIDFAVASAAYEADIAAKGGFSVDCNTGGGHVSGPPVICPAIWQFFQDHPFGVKQTYASGLPASFPSYCLIGPREADGGAP